MIADAKKPAKAVAGFSNTNPAKGSRRPTVNCPNDNKLALMAVDKKQLKDPWIYEGYEYVLISPGNYDAKCTGWVPPAFVPQWGRHSLNLKFWILAESVELTMFINFGANKKIPGSQSRFFKSWVLVNGGLPRRGEAMSPEIFTDPSLLYKVRVEDAAKGADGKVKPACSIYSRVEEILEVQRP